MSYVCTRELNVWHNKPFFHHKTMNCLVMKALQEPFHRHGNNKEFMTKQPGPVNFDTNLLHYVTSRFVKEFCNNISQVLLTYRLYYLANNRTIFLNGIKVQEITLSIITIYYRLSFMMDRQYHLLPTRLSTLFDTIEISNNSPTI